MTIYVCPPAQPPIRLRDGWPFQESLRKLAADLAGNIQRPLTVRRLAALAPREHVLVVTCTTDDATVIATDAALHWLEDDQTGQWARWGWEELTAVGWDSGTSTLALTGQPPVRPGRFCLTLADPGPLVHLARERISFTTGFVTRVQMEGAGTVRVVVRLQPRTDRRDWYIYPHPAIDADDPIVRDRVTALVGRLRSETGL